MFSKLRKVVASALVIAGVGTAAHAVPVGLSIDFNAGSDTKHSIDKAGDFLSPNIKAFSSFTFGGTDTVGATGSGTVGDLRFISRANSGWGVFDPTGNDFSEGKRMGGGEALQISFNYEISLESFRLSATPNASVPVAEQIQRFDLYVRALGETDFTLALQDYAANPDGTAGVDRLVDLSSEGIVGSVFVLVSINNGIGSQGLRFGQFTGTAEVPLPATAPILGGALLLGGYVLRKRRKDA